jgi:prepilin-type N-terminal cleavage/methylation domain-containing protein
MKNERHLNGLTLIEVLLAVAILSMGLVVMLTAISRCLGVLKVSEHYHKAMWAMSAGEAEFPLLRKPDIKPDDYAVDEQEYDGILYSREVQDPDVDGEDSDKRLLILVTKVSWMGRGKEQTDEIPRYLFYKE